MARRILVPYDGSLQAHCALVEAARRAAREHAQTTLLAVAPEPLAPGLSCEALADARRRLAALLAQARGEFDQALRVQLEVRSGDPADEIVAVIESGDFDLVLMGVSSRSRFRSPHEGTVARAVCSRCNCAVVLSPAIPWRERRWMRPGPVRQRGSGPIRQPPLNFARAAPS